VTFTEGVLRLVRANSQADRNSDPDPSGYSASEEATAVAGPASPTFAVELYAQEEVGTDSAAAWTYLEPGFPDIEAAVALVEAGLATRIVLTGFPSWPGLLWQAYQLAEAAGVQILPTVVRPGGKVDIVITRNSAANG
jgi:hypothetical protein